MPTESANPANLSFIAMSPSAADENFNVAFYAGKELPHHLQRADALLNVLVSLCEQYDDEHCPFEYAIGSMGETAEEAQRLIGEALAWWEAVSGILSPAVKA